MKKQMVGSKARRAVIAGLLLLAVAPACGSSKSHAAVPAATQKGGTVTVVGFVEPISFNVKIPAKQTSNLAVMSSVWRGVWTATPDFQFTLNTDLVTSAEMTSPDPQTIVYKINPKAVWSDGVPVSADDFIYNWETARPGATDVDGSAIQSVALPGGPDPITTVTGSDDGKTVTVVYKQPNVQWKVLFNYLIPAHIARRVGFNTGFDRFDPNVEVSNGPFKIASYNPGKDLTLVRNDGYWGTPANLDRIVIRFTTSDAGVAALKNGEGDAMATDVSPDLVVQLEQMSGITTHLIPTLNQAYVGFNLRNEFLADPVVRQAFALAVDRQAIVDRLVPKGQSEHDVNSFLRIPGQPGYRDVSGGRYDHQDVAAAKRLLAGAGFVLGPDGVYSKDGNRLSLRARTFTMYPYDAALQLVQAQVRQAGIELRIDNAPLNVIAAQLSSGDFDVELSSYGKNVFGTSNQFRPGNRWGYTNEAPNDLIAQSNLQLDDAKRAAMLDQADGALWADLPVLPLYQTPTLVAARNAIQNIEPNPAVAPVLFWNADRWAYLAKK
jgi:peptide/nickel transport system substrate-binding protein